MRNNKIVLVYNEMFTHCEDKHTEDSVTSTILCFQDGIFSISDEVMFITDASKRFKQNNRNDMMTTNTFMLSHSDLIANNEDYLHVPPTFDECWSMIHNYLDDHGMIEELFKAFININLLLVHPCGEGIDIVQINTSTKEIKINDYVAYQSILELVKFETIPPYDEESEEDDVKDLLKVEEKVKSNDTEQPTLYRKKLSYLQ